MRSVLAVLLVSTALAGCNRPAADEADRDGAGRGRFVGVGIYSPGAMWEQLAAPAARSSAAAATLQDDDEIIVVMDSKTGELRQCGNLSGHCIAFNPWAKPLGPGQHAPVQVLKHAQQLAADAEAESETQSDAAAQAATR